MAKCGLYDVGHISMNQRDFLTIDRAHRELQNDAKIYGKIYRARYFLSSTLSKIYEKLHKWQNVVRTMLVIFW